MNTIPLETFRAWLSTLGILFNAVVALRVVPAVLQYLRESRAQKLKERQSDREGWGELITTLRAEVDRMNTAHADCESRLRTMQGEIDGLRRMIVMHSGMGAVQLSPTITEAADRTAAHVMQAMDRDEQK